MVIRPREGIELLDLGEFWEYRQLLGFLALRDLKVRYKQTVIGVGWAVLQPLALMVVFTVFFGQLARIPSDGIPYPLFALSGLLPWNLFARVMASSADSLIRDQRLISKVYFPRLIVPVSASLAALVDFVITFGLLLGLMAIFRIVPGPEIVLLPLLTLLFLMAALGIGFWLGALNVEFRDVQQMLPFLTQLWFFLTPVVYPSSLVPDSFRLLYSLNPMVGVVEGFRWALLGGAAPSMAAFLVSTGVAAILFLTGLLYFCSRQRSFADNLG